MYRKTHFLGFVFLVAALLLVVAAPQPAAAVGPTIKWVDAAAGSDLNDGNSEATAYATLQQALDNSESGLSNANRSFIYVKNGTYSSAGYANTCEGIPGAVYVHNLDWLTIQAAAGHEPVVKPPAGIMSVVVEGSDHLVVDNLDSDQTVALTDNWNVCDSDDLTLRNSTFQGGSDGIDVHTALTAMLIEDNTFKNIVNGSGDEVLDFTDQFSYSGVVIQDNDFINNYRQITLNPDPGGSANNFLIQRNWMNGTTSEEAIRLINAGNIDIINNVILNGKQEGVYVDIGCSDIDIVHNTFFNNSLQTGPKLGEIRTNVSTAGIKITNNIVHGNGTNPAIVASVASLPGEDYNLFYNYVPAGSFTTFGPNSMSGQDPLFVSTTAGSEDLHLTFNSPAIESALPSAISDDKDKGPRPNPAGTDPDRGAYEFVAGTITVKKVAPGGGLTAFTFDPSWSATNFTLKDGESTAATPLPAGNYSVSEVMPLPAGWSLDSATCDNMTTTPVEMVAPSSIPVANGDAWVCTFTNVYTPSPTNTCPAADADSLYTDILGEGMGSPRKHRAKAKVVIPNWQNVDELYGQMSAKAAGLSNYVRFILPGANNYVQVNSITSPAAHDAGNFWYGATLPAPVKYVTGRWFLQGSGAKRHIPRAITLYATYDDPANSYVNVWDTFDGAEGEVHWDAALGWVPYQEIVVPIAAPLGETDLHVEVALVDNDKDARPVWVTVEAGGATLTQTPTGPNAGDQLNLMNFDLVDVDAGADEIVIKVYSPSPIIDGVEGDSAAVVGMAGYYRCAAIP